MHVTACTPRVLDNGGLPAPAPTPTPGPGRLVVEAEAVRASAGGNNEVDEDDEDSNRGVFKCDAEAAPPEPTTGTNPGLQ